MQRLGIQGYGTNFRTVKKRLASAASAASRADTDPTLAL